MAKRRTKKKDKVFVISVVLFFVFCLSLVGCYYIMNNKNLKIEKLKPKNKIKIVDQDSKERPIAVMIDNNVGYDNHAGLQDSYINYEMIVEGGYTRIMALFKDKDINLIGPVRSSRHYFLDYALESDAIYSHYGWSPYAENDISVLGVDNLNGMTIEKAYWRDNSIKAPHNVFTDIERLYKYSSEKGYNVKSNNWKLLNYSSEEINLNGSSNDGTNDYILANNIILKYSNNHTTSYSYDIDKKYYMRLMDNNKHIDKTTKEQLHYKNIVIMKVKNRSLDNYGRQDLDTVGNGEGYYITNGYALPIKWIKEGRSEKTKYIYNDGSVVKFNDGNTFIQIIPVTTIPEFS